jgi:adenine phosphoribosyltransferase
MGSMLESASSRARLGLLQPPGKARLYTPPAVVPQYGSFHMNDLKLKIREIPDFPKPGILFYDITTLLKDAAGFRAVIDGLKREYEGIKVDTVLGIEARGFIFAPALAYALNAGFVPVRKPKKLPGETTRITYDLEYGTDTLEIHRDAIGNGHRVLIIDDLLATGGTACAVAKLVEQMGGIVAGLGFVVELTFLNGREKLQGHDIFSLIQYDK